MYPIVSKHFYMAGSHRHSKNILNIKEANISIKLPTSPDIRYEAMKPCSLSFVFYLIILQKKRLTAEQIKLFGN